MLNSYSVALSDFDELLDHVNSAANTHHALEETRCFFGYKYYAFRLGVLQMSEVARPFIRTNYPAEWVSRYLLNDYVGIDPVVREGFTRLVPFDWCELSLDEDAMVVRTEARGFDLGRRGYTIPVIDRNARRSVFSFTSDLDDRAWDDFIATNREILTEVAVAVHRHALMEAPGAGDEMPVLGPRELECLTWTAKGKDYLDIAAILGISGHTVRGYLKSARFKLECVTLPQAVARAQKFGLIRV